MKIQQIYQCFPLNLTIASRIIRLEPFDPTLMDDSSAFALSVSFVLLVGGISFYFRRKKRDRESEWGESRDRIARDLHDDVASTLGSIALYAELLRSKLIRPSPEVTELIDRISTLSSDAVDAIGDIVWSVSPQHDSTQELFTHISDVVAQVCTLHSIHYETSIAEPPSELKISGDARRNIYLIFKESLSNVIKHANATKVKVAVGVEGGRLGMVIWDNGNGFVPESTGFGIRDSSQRRKIARGHGLRNMEKRAREIDARLSITSHPSKGTTVSLKKRVE